MEIFKYSFVSSNTGRTYTVALWDRRVNKEYCDGEGTNEVPGPKCKENGYHLEGDLDRNSGYISHVLSQFRGMFINR